MDELTPPGPMGPGGVLCLHTVLWRETTRGLGEGLEAGLLAGVGEGARAGTGAKARIPSQKETYSTRNTVVWRDGVLEMNCIQLSSKYQSINQSIGF